MPLLSEPTRINKPPPPLRAWVVAAFLLVAGLTSPPAQAMQPLALFLEAAHKGAVDARLAAARRAQADRERSQAKLGLAPTLGLDAGYTLNQFEGIARIPTGGEPKQVVITPQHQLDASLRITQPLVDVGKWMALGTANARVRAESANLQQSLVELDREVARAYYQVVATSAVVQTAARSLASAQENLRVVEARARQELASDLDVKRALAEVEAVRQTTADADYQLAIALRALHSTSGLQPSGDIAALGGTLVPEDSLEHWQNKVGDQVASLEVAHARVEHVQAEFAQARSVFYPNISLFAQERFTNAVGFIGKNAIGSIGVSLVWRLDLAALPALQVRKGNLEIARLEAEKAGIVAVDDVHRQWHAVRAAIVKAQAARAQVDATFAATERAKQRFAAGAALLFDVIQSERDQLSAEVRRIQADADLELSRVLLRIAAGEDPRRASSTATAKTESVATSNDATKPGVP